MSRTKMRPCIVLLLFALGCNARTDVALETTQLLETDRAWAKLAASSKDVDSVLAYWTDDARVVLSGEPIVEGKDAIRKMVAHGINTPGFNVTWTPEVAVVAASGDLGYTRGMNQFTVPDSTGGTRKLIGRYLTVWRKGTDGRWRCVEDFSNPAPAEAVGG